jgi:hypothetical protein
MVTQWWRLRSRPWESPSSFDGAKEVVLDRDSVFGEVAVADDASNWRSASSMLAGVLRKLISPEFQFLTFALGAPHDLDQRLTRVRRRERGL